MSQLAEPDERPPTDPEAALRDARHDLLTMRDTVIGLQATVGQLRLRAERAEQRVHDMETSTTWRIGQKVLRPLRRMRGR